MTSPAPSVGRVVHYRSYGTPGGEFASMCRAALITEVDPTNPDRVGLVALNPTGLFFHSLADGGSTYDACGETAGNPDCPSPETHGNPFRYCACGWIEGSYRGGTWHWPERVG